MKLFTDHPESVGETYFEHMQSALFFASQLFVAMVCCVIHAALPFLFKANGSRIISDLHERMVAKRARAQQSDFLRSRSGGATQAVRAPNA